MTGKSRWWSYDSTKQVAREKQARRTKQEAREKQARREQNVPFQSASIDQIKDRTHGRNRKVRRGS
jgi:hypothetical protein